MEKKTVKEEQRNKKDMRLIENKEKSGRQKSTILIMALKVNGLNNPIKKKRLSDWIKKEPRMNYIFSTRDTLRFKITNNLKVKGQKEI